MDVKLGINAREMIDEIAAMIDCGLCEEEKLPVLLAAAKKADFDLEEKKGKILLIWRESGELVGKRKIGVGRKFALEFESTEEADNFVSDKSLTIPRFRKECIKVREIE